MKKICENEDCRKEFETRDNRKRFCSRSCSAHCNNRGVRRHGREAGNCLNCGEKLSSSRKIYCNSDCQMEYLSRVSIEKWGKGEWNGSMKDGTISSTIRKKVIDDAGNRCQKCGWNVVNDFTGVIPLQVHHKDGNFKNNKRQNLEVLCPNCHSLTENFGRRQNKFEGNSRRKRSSSSKEEHLPVEQKVGIS